MPETRLTNCYSIENYETMKRKACFVILIMLIISSCSSERFGYSNKKYGKGYKETFSFHFVTLIDFYTVTYGQLPESAKDIITFIEGMNEDSRLWYESEYDYFKRNEDKLIFVPDSLISIYYKKVNAKNLLLQTSASNPCEYLNSSKTYFFDEQGYYFSLDSLSSYVEKRLLTEYWKYHQTTKDVAYERVILEYTPNNLKNLCANKVLDITQSTFFANAYNFLDSLAQANNMTRITVPTFIDKFQQN